MRRSTVGAAGSVQARYEAALPHAHTKYVTREHILSPFEDSAPPVSTLTATLVFKPISRQGSLKTCGAKRKGQSIRLRKTKPTKPAPVDTRAAARDPPIFRYG